MTVFLLYRFWVNFLYYLLLTAEKSEALRPELGPVYAGQHVALKASGTPVVLGPFARGLEKRLAREAQASDRQQHTTFAAA